MRLSELFREESKEIPIYKSYELSNDCEEVIGYLSITVQLNIIKTLNSIIIYN